MNKKTSQFIMQYVCMCVCVFEILEGQSYILQSFMKTPPL